MKTIKEWLSELPEPYKTQAIAYNEPDWERTTKGSLSQAIVSGFIWSETSEGPDYWMNLHDQILDNENK